MHEIHSRHATHVASSNTFTSGMLHRHTSPCSNRAVNATQLGLQPFVLGASPTKGSQTPNKQWPIPFDWMNDSVVLYASLYIEIFVCQNSHILRCYVLLTGDLLQTFRMILVPTFLDASLNALLVLFFTKYERSTNLRNVGKYLPVDTTWHPKRP